MANNMQGLLYGDVMNWKLFSFLLSSTFVMTPPHPVRKFSKIPLLLYAFSEKEN
jgi:hypothetical protein